MSGAGAVRLAPSILSADFSRLGELVRYAQMEGKSLAELTLDEYRRFSPEFEEDVLAIDLRSAIEARDAPGGTSSRQVEAALAKARERLAAASRAEPTNERTREPGRG